MAKWIGDARAVDEADSDPESDDDDSITQHIPAQARAAKWSPTELSVLFGGQVVRSDRSAEMRFDEEAALMEALANQEEEDEYHDGGAMEGSGDDYKSKHSGRNWVET